MRHDHSPHVKEGKTPTDFCSYYVRKECILGAEIVGAAQDIARRAKFVKAEAQIYFLQVL